MDGTLFVARGQDRFPGGYALYFWVRSAPIVAPTSHPWRTHLPSIRHALLHQRYAISAAHVRLPLLALIHERRGRGILRASPFTISANFAVTAFSEVRRRIRWEA